ncbi:apolipoprotein N-acyltransferase [Aromatoleum toluvorans]|uniref:Apolipoprotein N-acyltransferase n=1 Tax=Aromatoleum toluvorans TaxID=92002 RepID=A0ABX1PVW2_9RHOO|nr:apolipoprotein N-acyltransferase [Aromatoleum toluvorans]NMG43559.1 apolipoprotein N-acyltransferase [Aromatoleum toluvorans]
MRGLIAAMLAGGASVFAFAPFEVFPLTVASLAILAFLAARESRARSGFALGFAWGLGAFLAGVSWLYVALNRYGGMPMPLAALAILLFCAYLALFPAAVGALFARFGRGGVWLRALFFAGLWVGTELLRGWLFTGFPWLALGYSQTPPSPLAGYLPVLGVYGVGGLVALIAARVALTPWRNLRAAAATLVAVAALSALGYGLGRVAWTSPTGKPVDVALIQTNIEQGLKWRPELLSNWLESNARLAREHPADLVVLPETTLPLLADRLPDGYLEELAAPVAAHGGDLVFGVFLRDARGAIYNAALSLGASPSQAYAKQHLVPFGEYSPPLFGWFYEFARIPMSDQTRGAPDQSPLRLGGQRVAVNICYEDLFGRELIHSLPEATLMLNLSNLAWYGDSLAQPQHLQIARVRALETGRPMLRSTNTGMTALVQPDGRVAGVLPEFQEGVLKIAVQGHEGLTPYARWGDAAAALLALVAVLAGAVRRAGRP